MKTVSQGEPGEGPRNKVLKHEGRREEVVEEGRGVSERVSWRGRQRGKGEREGEG